MTPLRVCRATECDATGIKRANVPGVGLVLALIAITGWMIARSLWRAGPSPADGGANGGNL